MNIESFYFSLSEVWLILSGSGLQAVAIPLTLFSVYIQSKTLTFCHFEINLWRTIDD